MSEQVFTPDAEHQRALRDALGRFATGVTVVTTQTADGPVGITANSFAALSLEPALVMWAPGRFSRRFEIFDRATHFAIHVMAEDQLDVARHFARDGFDFSLPGIEAGLGDAPLLPGCLARFECARHAVYPGGDHAIVVGEVLRVTTREGAGLSFFGGAYGSIG
ncbi:flavin reductase family protein [Roseibaca sp. V10]|uniref:Flavin reductase family protein n=1 Tax=Roseinatronobacter domitianus TaxID=2940293 RepID=A0ABT0M2Q3_9RHOB|nr:flavin reductase family protein [Roseibaca domitiana]MCL1629127.1 flavin reductase family protein [Roseibaca domitiana]